MKTHRIELCRAVNREWYWRAIHKNGKEIARSSETYKRKNSAVRAMNRLFDSIQTNDFSVETER